MPVFWWMRLDLVFLVGRSTSGPFSSLFAQVLGFSFGFGPPPACRLPEGIFSSLRQDVVKGAAD